LLKDLTESN